jgi:hypothetical protein
LIFSLNKNIFRNYGYRNFAYGESRNPATTPPRPPALLAPPEPAEQLTAVVRQGIKRIHEYTPPKFSIIKHGKYEQR